MNHIYSFLKELVYFYNEIAIYLLFGFLVAGILHVLFPDSLVRRHLGRSSLGSVVKASVFGIPLPLCSCGVVPVGTSLKKSGASKGSIVSFLVATPQIGADSFLITYSLLGWVFGLFRIAASFITAMIAGVLINIFDHKKDHDEAPQNMLAGDEEGPGRRLKTVINYIEYELLGSLANALVVGLIIAALINVLIPEGFFETYLGNSFLSMVVMMAIGIPMYVCASASTPIAASLIMKGISPGAALVFLLTGPATNAVNFTTVNRIVGKKSTAIYFGSIALVSLALGSLLNYFSASMGIDRIITHQHGEAIPGWLNMLGSITLAAMLAWYYFEKYIGRNIKRKRIVEVGQITLDVKGMTCMHCAGTVKKAVESVEGTSDVFVDLDNDKVTFQLKEEEKTAQIKEKIRLAGYEV